MNQKQNTRFSLHIPPKLREKLVRYSEETERPMTELIQEALREYFERKGIE